MSTTQKQTWVHGAWMATALALTLPVGARGAEVFDESGMRADVSPGVAIAAARTAAVAPGGLPQAMAVAAQVAAPTSAPRWTVFEDWRTPTIRSDRWVGVSQNAHDMRREIVGNHLAYRFRLEAPKALLDVGSALSAQRLVSRTAALTTRIAADWQIKSYEVVGCPANPLGTRVRPAIVDVTGFNDGSSSRAGDATGDYFLRVVANREADSVDPWNELRVQAFLFRCSDAGCTNTLSSVFDLDVGRVFVGIPFTLRAEWDPAQHQVVAGVSGYPDVRLAYDPAIEVSPPRVPFASIRQQNLSANCSTLTTVTDSIASVFEVRTNPEAAVP